MTMYQHTSKYCAKGRKVALIASISFAISLEVEGECPLPIPSKGFAQGKAGYWLGSKWHPVK